MGLSVLVISDAMVQKGADELFNCLFGDGIEKVWHVGLDDAAESYAETGDDWDVVIIHNECHGILADILEMDAQQVVIVISEWLVGPVRTAYGFELPENAELLESALKDLGTGGAPWDEIS